MACMRDKVKGACRTSEEAAAFHESEVMTDDTAVQVRSSG